MVIITMPRGIKFLRELPHPSLWRLHLTLNLQTLQMVMFHLLFYVILIGALLGFLLACLKLQVYKYTFCTTWYFPYQLILRFAIKITDIPVLIMRIGVYGTNISGIHIIKTLSFMCDA